MKKNFRFYDNRQKYLLFVTTTNEKNQIADAIRPHVNKIKPQKPGIKIFVVCNDNKRKKSNRRCDTSSRK